jgi:hypothetical protein
VRQWWNYPFAVAGPASVLFFVSLAGAGIAGIVAFDPPKDALPALLVLVAGSLVLQQARRRFMRRREIAAIGSRSRRSYEIATAIAAVAAVTIPIAFHWNFAWAFPLFAVFSLAYEIDRRQSWTRRGRPGDPRWALDWSPETDPVYDLLAVGAMRRKDYTEARHLLERAHVADLDGGRKVAALYHLACIEAVSGQREAALDHLNAAVAVDDLTVPAALKQAQTDPDLASIRDDPRFPAAVSP